MIDTTDKIRQLYILYIFTKQFSRFDIFISNSFLHLIAVIHEQFERMLIFCRYKHTRVILYLFIFLNNKIISDGDRIMVKWLYLYPGADLGLSRGGRIFKKF